MGWKTKETLKVKAKRKAEANKLSNLLNSCKNREDCLLIALKRAMLQIKDNTLTNPLEVLAMQLVASRDARDHEFILDFFPDLEAAKAAENEFAALNSGG